jgi:hypothetical protein
MTAPGGRTAREWDRAPCKDCGQRTIGTRKAPGEWYMVHDELWAQAGMEPLGGWLCVGCLERRLGRRLASADFKPVPANDSARMRHSDRLASRIRGTGVLEQGVLW